MNISPPTGWRYQGGSRRDLRLDLLRGFAGLAMIVDHIGGANSWFYLVTGGNQFFVSAAESFVLIAGLTMGIVYQRLIATQGVRAAVKKALHRAGSLYVLTIALTFAFAALSAYFQLTWAPRIGWAEVPRWTFEVATLQRTYYLVDIPLLYVLLVALSAPLLVALARGWSKYVLAASWALWLGWQVARVHVPWVIEDNALFHFSAWQLVFVHGLVIGYAHQQVGQWFARTGVSYARVLLVSGAIAGVLVWLVLTQRHEAGLLAPGSFLGEQLAQKDDVTIVRIASVAVMFALGWSLLTLAWRPIERATNWLLMPLGQNSLNAYTYHVIVVGLLAAATPTWTVSRGAGWNTSVQLLGLVMVYAVIVLSPLAAAPFVHWRGSLARTVRGNSKASRAPGLRLRRMIGIAGSIAIAGGIAFALTPSTPSAEAASTGAPAQPLPMASRTALPGHLAVYAEPAGLSNTALGAIQERRFYSTSLARVMPYTVYLPPGYRESDERYPVLYMLHGLGGDHLTEWRSYGIFDVAEAMMSQDLMRKFIVVLVEGETSYYIDHAYDGPKWGTYVALDVVNDVDRTFRTVRDREARAIGGNSMGGHGALQLGLNFPERFGVVGAHSPTFRDPESALPFFGDPEYRDAHTPATLVAAFPERLQRTKLWLDVGEADPWLYTIDLFHQQLVDLGVEHRYEVLPGDHSDEYWASHVYEYLNFYAEALRGEAPPPEAT